MSCVTYTVVPTPARFQKDSSVTFAFRKDDPVLTNLDWLLEHYDKQRLRHDRLKCRVLLSHLFLSANSWVKGFSQKDPRMKKERYPAVIALFEAVVNELAGSDHFNLDAAHFVPVAVGQDAKAGPVWRSGNRASQVASRIREYFGQKLHADGYDTDVTHKMAKYFTECERQVYRLRFCGGRAYQYPWWLPHHPTSMVPAESEKAEAGIARREENSEDKYAASPGYGNFVMTLEREVFMAKHTVSNDVYSSIFHSSYTAGGPVILAGSMLVKRGDIRAIRCDSGHYRPSRFNVVLGLQGLQMHGVNLRRVRLYDFKGGDAGTAYDFLRKGVKWDDYINPKATPLVGKNPMQPLPRPAPQQTMANPLAPPDDPTYFNAK